MGAVSPASPAQRAKARAGVCIVSGQSWPSVTIDAAHVIPRSLTKVGQDDARAIVPLRRDLHRLYDSGALDLLPWLERSSRVELGFAVERVGLLTTLRRVTNSRAAA